MGSNVGQTTPKEEQGSNPRNRDLECQKSREKILAVLGLIAVIGGTAAGYLAALGVTGLKPVSISLLIVAALALPLLWLFTDLSNSKVFNVSILTVLTLILVGVGVYVGFLSESHLNSKVPRFPTVRFDYREQAIVPWCSAFDLTTSGRIPNGYKLSVFAAGTGPNWNVGEGYMWIGNATPIEGRLNQWITPFVYIGPPSSDHKVNRGFRGVVVAVILSDQSSSILSVTVGQKNRIRGPHVGL